MGRSRDHDIDRHFKSLGTGPAMKSPQVQCKYCNKPQARHASRMRSHLETECPQYNFDANSVQKVLFGSERRAKKIAVRRDKWNDDASSILQQSQISFEEGYSITTDQFKGLDRQAALAVYHGCQPFSLYDDPYMSSFIKQLFPVYKPPSASRLAGALLDDIFRTVHDRVQPLIQNCDNYSVCLDETTSITNSRVLNLFATTTKGTFFQGHIQLSGATLTAQFLAQQMILQLTTLYGSDALTRCISVATNTCSQMQSFWGELETQKEFKSVLFVPCDSHGIQQLVKDILELDQFSTTFSNAQTVVNYFHQSPKQYQLLKRFMKELGHRKKTLISAVLTRWGTQFRLLDCLEQHEMTLRCWARDRTQRIDAINSSETAAIERIEAIVTDIKFWRALGTIRRILLPIHQHQIQSEARNAHLGTVYPRWKQMRGAIYNVVQTETIEDEDLLLEIFDIRQRKQLRAFHYLAYHLTPQSMTHIGSDKSNFTDDSKFAGDIIAELLRLAGPDNGGVLDEYMDYRASRGFYDFTCDNRHANNVSSFWELTLFLHPTSKLAPIAIKLFQTPAHSVFSERVFSTMQLTHNKLRNRLSPGQVAKLCYTHINQRMLDYAGQSKIRLHEWSDNDWASYEEDTIIMTTAGYQDDDIHAIMTDSEINKLFRQGLQLPEVEEQHQISQASQASSVISIEHWISTNQRQG